MFKYLPKIKGVENAVHSILPDSDRQMAIGKTNHLF